jgi:hypothetical protein
MQIVENICKKLKLIAFRIVLVIAFIALGGFLSTIYAQITFEKTYGGAGYDKAFSAQETSDGGFIVAGFTSSFGAGEYDVYLIKTDSLGDTLWTRTYGDSTSNHGYSVQQTSDGGYIIAGETYDLNTDRYDVYLVKTDSLGDTLWTKIYGGTENDAARSVKHNCRIHTISCIRKFERRHLPNQDRHFRRYNLDKNLWRYAL